MVLIYSLKTQSSLEDLLCFKDFATLIISASLNSWSSSWRVSNIWQINFSGTDHIGFVYIRFFSSKSILIFLNILFSEYYKHYYHICAVYCKEYHLTVSRNKRNDILFIGKLSSVINLYNVWDFRGHFVRSIF